MRLKGKKTEKFGERVGYIVMYFIFTTFLYFILSFLNKLPENWGYFHVVLLTITIILVGTLLKMLLR